VNIGGLIVPFLVIFLKSGNQLKKKFLVFLPGIMKGLSKESETQEE
jgi:hypothetical protein